MKKWLCFFLCCLTVALVPGCSQNQQEFTVSESEPLSPMSEEPVRSKAPVNHVIYPDRIDEIDAEHLRYKSKSGTYTAIFPKIFAIESNELLFDDGIYLMTEDGKATLQLDYVESPAITREELIRYLSARYLNSQLETIDDDMIAFKTTLTDKSSQPIISYLKARLSTNGYCEIIMSFHESERSKYEPLIQKIDIK